MRQGELLGLKWTDVDWVRGFLRIQRQLQRFKGQGMVTAPPKTKASRRTVPLGNETIQFLRQHKTRLEDESHFLGPDWHEHGLIFPTRTGNPNSPSNLLKEYKALLEKAGLPTIRFHDLRHTAASIMLNRGVPAYVVSRILGHLKPSTTLDIYGHLIPVMHEDLGNRMDEWVTPIAIEMGENANPVAHPQVEK